ncbi:MAG: CBS domain-containing protein [Methanosarcinaceae archaeon]|nr:CBS domain-containing protein [Methanosarcinaceae archaeon]
MVEGSENDTKVNIEVKEIENEMSVREIMTKKVFSTDIKTTITDVAREMIKCNVGSIIVTEVKEAVGIITERDIVRKISTEIENLDRVCASEIMSSPIITAKPSTNIIDAAEQMVKCNIRRLPVMDGSNIVGIVTDRDILMVSPGLNTILANLIEMNHEQSGSITHEPEGGICEYCGSFSNDILLSNGMMMCESCRDTEGYYD